MPEEESEEVRLFLEQHPQAAAAWEKESTFLIDPYPRTDYIVVVEHQLQSGNTEP